MGFAVNASTMGMAVAGLAIAFFSRRINRRTGILLSLALLSIPTALLASAPDLMTFTVLRVTQGLFMSSAFTLTLAYLAEHCSARDSAAAFAAYITGNVASNLIGRLISAALADHLGLAANFYVFAVLNLAGAVLVYFTLARTTPMAATGAAARSPLAIWAEHLRNAPLRAAFVIGFCILFAFIGTFTYVNFVLVRAPFEVGPMALGFVYFVFLPSILTTPLAGRAVQRLGTRPTFWLSLAIAAIGLPLMLLSSLPALSIGLMLIGVGTFLAQATATGFVGRAATTDRGSASGIYLACYFFGGLVGSAVLGQLYDRLRLGGLRRRHRRRRCCWPACSPSASRWRRRKWRRRPSEPPQAESLRGPLTQGLPRSKKRSGRCASRVMPMRTETPISPTGRSAAPSQSGLSAPTISTPSWRRSTPKRLGEPAGTARQVAVGHRAAPPAHQRQPLDRLERAQQHAGARARPLARYVEQMPHAIAEIDIGVAAREEQRGVARRPPAKAVAGGVAHDIGLGLDDAAAHPAAAASSRTSVLPISQRANAAVSRGSSRRFNRRGAAPSLRPPIGGPTAQRSRSCSLRRAP